MTETRSVALNRPKQETFAQACARGLSPRQAAQSAAYADPSYGGTLVKNREVAARIAAIVQRRGVAARGDVGGLVDRLIAIADTAAKGSDARGLDVARGCLTDAARLMSQLPAEPALPRPAVRSLTMDEWRAKNDPHWPGRPAAAAAVAP